MRGYNDPRFTAPSDAFDAWLSESAAMDGPARAKRLTHWESAPAARLSHPKAEHLLPLMVAAGASANPGRKIYSANKSSKPPSPAFSSIKKYNPHPEPVEG